MFNFFFNSCLSYCGTEQAKKSRFHAMVLLNSGTNLDQHNQSLFLSVTVWEMHDKMWKGRKQVSFFFTVDVQTWVSFTPSWYRLKHLAVKIHFLIISLKQKPSFPTSFKNPPFLNSLVLSVRYSTTQFQSLSTLLSLFMVSSIWFHPLLFHTEVLYYAGGAPSSSASLSHHWPFLPTSISPLSFISVPPSVSLVSLCALSLSVPVFLSLPCCHNVQHLFLPLKFPGIRQQCLSLL